LFYSIINCDKKLMKNKYHYLDQFFISINFRSFKFGFNSK